MGKLRNQFEMFRQMGRFLQDENVRALLGHPKFQELLRDPEFRKIAEARDLGKLATHPKFSSVMNDPELAPILEKIRSGPKS